MPILYRIPADAIGPYDRIFYFSPEGKLLGKIQDVGTDPVAINNTLFSGYFSRELRNWSLIFYSQDRKHVIGVSMDGKTIEFHSCEP